MDRVIHRQAITHRLQHGAQGFVSVAFFHIRSDGNAGDPLVGFLCALLDHFQAWCAHCASPSADGLETSRTVRPTCCTSPVLVARSPSATMPVSSFSRV